MVLGKAGPREAAPGDLLAVKPRVADARERGREGRDLVHDLGGSEPGLGIPHAVHDVREDVRVKARAGYGHGLPNPLHAALGVAEGPLLLGVARAGEHHVGVLRGLGEEELVHNQELEAREGLDHMMDVRVRADRVLAEDEEPLDVARDHLREALRGVEARVLRELPAPGLFEARDDLRVAELLVPGQVPGGRPHVAGALDVVLAAQRVDAAAGLAEVAGHHRDVRE